MTASSRERSSKITELVGQPSEGQLPDSQRWFEICRSLSHEAGEHRRLRCAGVPSPTAAFREDLCEIDLLGALQQRALAVSWASELILLVGPADLLWRASREQA